MFLRTVMSIWVNNRCLEESFSSSPALAVQGDTAILPKDFQTLQFLTHTKHCALTCVSAGSIWLPLKAQEKSKHRYEGN